MNERDERPTADCVAVDALADVDPTTDDTRWRHVSNCARCHALWLEFRSFVSAQPEPPEARTAEAMQHLSAVLEREIGGAPAPRPARELSWWQRLGLPRLQRALWVPTAAVAIVALVLVMRPDDPPGQNGVTRGGNGDAMRAEATLQAGTSSLPGQHVRFEWQPVEGVDGYELQILSAEHDELWKQTTTDTFRVVAVDSLPVAQDVVLWRVRALRFGDTIATSTTHALELRL